MSDGYWFRSPLFKIERGEDDDINPGIYGRQLAVWLRQKLEQRGYEVEDIINEDWGRCLMCQRAPFSVWVGVGSVASDAFEERATSPSLPESLDVVWHCFAVVEVPFFRRLFGKQAESQAARNKIDATLRAIPETAIELVPE